MSTGPLHSVSVAGVVLDHAQRVLLIKRRDNGQWQAPGGVLELSERFEQGVVREVKEETGMLVAVERLTGVYKNLAIGVVALVYRCHVVGGEIATSDESSEVRWIPIREAIDLMSPAFAVRVLDARDTYSVIGAASRAHDGIDLR